MAADRCSPNSFQRCEAYLAWKQSPVVRLHDWSLRSRQFGRWWVYPPNLLMRIYFRTLWLVERLTAKKRAPHRLTPGEKIIVGLMLVGQYENYPLLGSGRPHG